MNSRPRIGQPTLLVYRECPCGDWCATGEGAVAPQCTNCDGLYLPPGGTVESPTTHDDWVESRRYRGLGFFASLCSEQGAVHLVSKALQDMGLMSRSDGRWHLTLATERFATYAEPRYYAEAEIQRLSDQIKSAPPVKA